MFVSETSFFSIRNALTQS